MFSVIFSQLVSRSRARSAARPVYHILWVRSFRGHTISRRGFNLFKPLRRHFPATPISLSRHDPATETPRLKRSTIDSTVSSWRRRRNGLSHPPPYRKFPNCVLHAGLKTPRPPGQDRGGLKMDHNTHPVFRKDNRQKIDAIKWRQPFQGKIAPEGAPSSERSTATFHWG